MTRPTFLAVLWVMVSLINSGGSRSIGYSRPEQHIYTNVVEYGGTYVPVTPGPVYVPVAPGRRIPPGAVKTHRPRRWVVSSKYFRPGGSRGHGRPSKSRPTHGERPPRRPSQRPSKRPPSPPLSPPPPPPAVSHETPKPSTPSQPPASTPNSPMDLNKMLAEVNKVRAKAGVSPLTISNQLTIAAQKHSEDQARVRKMSHFGSDGSSPSKRVDRTGYDWKSIGENVAYNQRTVEEAMEAWIKSPEHYKNLVSPTFTEFGAGVKDYYWTQDFGSS